MQSASKALYQAQELWHHIFGDERGLLQIFTAERAEGRLTNLKDAYYNYPNAVEAAASWALEKSQEGREVYFCAHLLTAPERRKENAGGVRALWAELDGSDLPSGNLTPTAVVESSPGRYHAYWRLTDAIPPEAAEALNKRIARAIGADDSGADLTQLLRVPDTPNRKYEGGPAVRLLGAGSGQMYSPAQLEEILPENMEEAAFSTASEVDEEILDGSRNRDLTSIGGTLRRRGLDEVSIFAALTGINETKCRPPLGKEEVASIARSVSRYKPAKTFPIKQNGRNSHSHSRIGNVNVNEEENGSTHHPKRSLRAVSFAGREKPPAQEFVVEKLVPRGMATSFYGGGGLAKSVNVLHLGLSAAFTGVDDWHGLRVATCPVIYLDFEMSEVVQLRRAKEIADGAGWPDVPKNFHYVEAAGYETADVFGFALELVAEHGPALTIVDSFGFSMQGESERSADVLGYVRDYIQPLQDTGSHPLIVDHIARTIKGERAADKEAFGSVYKTNSMRSTVNVTGHADEEAGTVYATFTHRKNNVGPRLKPFTIITKFSSDAITFERSDTVIHPPSEDTIEQLIVTAIREHGPMTNKQLAAVVDRNLQSVQNSTSRLKSSDVLIETGEKREREAVLEVAGL
jgi:RepB DNA-primase from phage plasmid/AAA domain/Primase C terminal 1 (PriCT-1)